MVSRILAPFAMETFLLYLSMEEQSCVVTASFFFSLFIFILGWGMRLLGIEHNFPYLQHNTSSLGFFVWLKYGYCNLFSKRL